MYWNKNEKKVIKKKKNENFVLDGRDSRERFFQMKNKHNYIKNWFITIRLHKVRRTMIVYCARGRIFKNRVGHIKIDFAYCTHKRIITYVHRAISISFYKYIIMRIHFSKLNLLPLLIHYHYFLYGILYVFFSTQSYRT